ncbi:DUF6777 domain-containing protein [Streptomyces eurocidicus]|uniref:DUF6777 domain-containing protein n=1 Tax=Streptomyces eurocidicus TaxID=66423 RepID=A0A7W8BE73_STREU|nr:DUF6777 domain-containing protein [Streptomyces eurocidicus]MBB5121735.1 hypothetical protein [Streptomyces eurocidicus]MBF6052953.1 hypothetical protein [Streptomyces eurocidicus]
MRMVTVRTVSLVTVTALLGGIGAAGCTKQQRVKAVELVLEAAGTIGVDPFLKHPDVDVKGVNSPSHGGGTVAVDDRGAFGGTRGTTHCDKSLLIKGITQDPAKARAWAGVHNIDPSRISAYINGLTEVNLEYDTLVKNHNYQGDGQIRGYLSVLQKGVVVLNDPLTGPAVKCNCGNPLLSPDRAVDLKSVTYKGERWQTFTSVEITVIAPRPKEKGPVKKVQLVDPFESGKAFDRTVGTDGEKDSKEFAWEPPPRPVPSKEPTVIVPPGVSAGPSSPGSAGPGSAGPGSSGPGSGGPGSSGPGSSGPSKGGESSTDPFPPGQGASASPGRPSGEPKPPSGGSKQRPEDPKNPSGGAKQPSGNAQQPSGGSKQPPSDPPKQPSVDPPKQHQADPPKQPPAEPKQPPTGPKQPQTEPKQPQPEPKQPQTEPKQPAQPKQPPAGPQQPPAEQKPAPDGPKQPTGSS